MWGWQTSSQGLGEHRGVRRQANGCVLAGCWLLQLALALAQAEPRRPLSPGTRISRLCAERSGRHTRSISRDWHLGTRAPYSLHPSCSNSSTRAVAPVDSCS